MKAKKLRKQEIAQKMKNLRVASGLTQSQVAEKLGLTYQAISNYERGKNSIETDLLFDMCEIYEVNPLSILQSELYTCPICGLSYASDYEPDVKEHNYYHEIFCKALAHYGFFYSWEKMGIRKSKIYDILYSENSTFEEKKDVALDLLRVYFSRSLGQHAYRLDHPMFNDYVAMLLNQNQFKERFGEEIYNSLVEKYGKKPGMPEGTTTYEIQKLMADRSGTKQAKKDSSLSDDSRRLAEDYDNLDEHGRRMIRIVADEEISRYSQEQENLAAAVLKSQKEQLEAAAEITLKQKIPTPVSESGLENTAECLMKYVTHLNPGQQKMLVNQAQRMIEQQKESTVSAVPQSTDNKVPKSELPDQS